MKKGKMGIAVVKDTSVTVHVEQGINENGKIYGTGHFNQRVVKHHQNGLRGNVKRPRKYLYLWSKKIKGVIAEIVQAVSSEGNVWGIGGIYFSKPKYTDALKRSNAKCVARRKRELGFIVIGMSHPCCDWHHIDKDHVVACPTYVHKHVSHICGDKKLEGVIG